MRDTSQGYAQPTSVKQGYALTENDTNSLKHTWFRKLDSKQGRFTSPDPYNGSMSIANPQSMNRYAYVSNDPVNFVDPSGLNMSVILIYGVRCHETEGPQVCQNVVVGVIYIGSPGGGGGDRGDGGGGGGSSNNEPPQDDQDDSCQGVEGFSGSVGGHSAQELNNAAITVFGEISSRLHQYLGREALAVASVIFNRSDAIRNGTQGNNPWGRSPSLSDVVGASAQFAGFQKGMSDINAGVSRANEFYEGQRNCERLRTAIDAVRHLANGGGRYPYSFFVSNRNGTRTLGAYQYRFGGNDFSEYPISTR